MDATLSLYYAQFNLFQMKMKGIDVDILLVEDSSDDYEIVSNILREERIHFLHVRDGVDALRYIFSDELATHDIHKLNLILLDLNLPKINGLEVLKKIRKDKRTHNIPVVILTSSDDSKEIYQAYDLGANSFVVKPTEFEKFVSTIQAISKYWTRVNHKYEA